VKAGPSAGEEKLLAVASVSPLGGADPASLLRGPERGPRYEWATDSASFEVRAAVRVTARPAAGGGEKPAPEKTAPRKADPDSSVPPPAEGSQVPADKGKPETAPEGKPAARPDAPKPEVSKPVAPKAAESSRVPAGEKSLLPPTRSTK
jgi:hypothetical protein